MGGLFKGVLAERMAVDRALLESKVFPDSALPSLLRALFN